MFGLNKEIFNQGIGIDIGTINTVIYVKDKGIVLDEPSVLAVRKVGRKGVREIIAFGEDAKKMVGRTPVGVTTIAPLTNGVIADFEMTEHLIRHFMETATESSSIFAHPCVAVCVPACVTEVEKRAVVEVTLAAGAKEALVVEEPIAAAIGIGINLDEPQGNMIVDIGGGSCEVAVISLGGIVLNEAVRVAGNALNEAIISMMRQTYKLAIGESTAEEIKIAIGSVVPLEQELQMDVKGRDLLDGLPKIAHITSVDVRDALDPVYQQIEETIRATLEKTPPELVRDIVDQGIVLTGGTALLRGIDMRLAEALNVSVHTVESPLYSVAIGLGKYIENRNMVKSQGITLESKEL